MVKKNWNAPRLSVYGDVAELTHQNGYLVTDVPIGTTTSVDGGVASGSCPPGKTAVFDNTILRVVCK